MNKYQVYRKDFLSGLLGLLLVAPLLNAAGDASFTRKEDVIYGRKFGMALTMDVFNPAQPNGLGVIFIVSAGWVSSKEAVWPQLYKPLLNHGYTVFAVMHGAQPKFQVPEIIQDLHRAVRYIRFNAAKFGIDPARLGVCGGSAGGHLSLILATQGGDGDAKAKDPVDRQSSAIQCAACFFPPTDFLNYGGPHTNVVGQGTLAFLKAAFGPVPSDPEAARKFGESISPIYSITSNLPPTLIIHGNADTLVPIQQALSFRDKAAAMGDTVKVITKEGLGHGWKNF
ncbi:MAG TPA: alpha/beta hydrolase, partial [Candidatus Saccharimonadales bacterium]|nr:alpha/beta hydrolase [Candidatus Saccharimonadales bacterium]